MSKDDIKTEKYDPLVKGKMSQFVEKSKIPELKYRSKKMLKLANFAKTIAGFKHSERK